MFFITILATAYAITATLRQSQLKSQLALKEQYEEDINNVNEIAQKLAYTGGKLDINSEEVQELIKQIKLSMYPVGSIYISTSNTNPSEFIGGTWESYGQGRTLVGIDETQTEFATVNQTGGEKTHTLNISEIPSHTHKPVCEWGTNPNTSADKFSSRSSSAEYLQISRNISKH